ncbi:hypothetical protein KAZ82_00730 [Candidatus Babeliales bacterium]|nr:hypothetical protein [Candidatus Babeliales bacterium]
MNKNFFIFCTLFISSNIFYASQEELKARIAQLEEENKRLQDAQQADGQLRNMDAHMQSLNAYATRAQDEFQERMRRSWFK